MGNFRAAFEAYGADYDGTMRRFLGNEAMYPVSYTHLTLPTT